MLRFTTKSNQIKAVRTKKWEESSITLYIQLKMRLAQTTTAHEKVCRKHRKVISIIQGNAVMFPQGVFGLRDSYFIENVYFCIHKEVSAACLCV